jgi:hypothetical protein
MSVNGSSLNRWKTSYANNCKASFPASQNASYRDVKDYLFPTAQGVLQNLKGLPTAAALTL